MRKLKKAVDIIIRYEANQYHLVRIDMSDERYSNDVAKAIRLEYNRYRSWSWKIFSCRQFSGIDYVKVTFLRL